MSAKKPLTDWEALRNMTAVQIRAGIDSDPDAKATDDDFWADGYKVMAADKEREDDAMEWCDAIAGDMTDPPAWATQKDLQGLSNDLNLLRKDLTIRLSAIIFVSFGFWAGVVYIVNS